MMRAFLTTIVVLPICSAASPTIVNSLDVPTTLKCEANIPIARSVSSTKNFSLPPFVPPLVLIDGQVKSVPVDTATTKTTEEDSDDSFEACCKISEVYGCCSFQPIGKMPQMTEAQSLAILKSARLGWNNGAGTWTQMRLQDRIERIRLFMQEFTKQRENIIHTLMWEIGKNYDDAEAEFDRTVQFINQTIDLVQSSAEFNPLLFSEASSSTNVFSKRNAIGIMLCLGPYNYPINETYATLIPALLMGNIVILKVPTIGGLSHLLTLDAFSKALPPNTIHVISGSGRSTLPSIMDSGHVDVLAFIGGTNAADNLIKQHPSPHRLKIFLQLEGKNMGLLLSDLFNEGKLGDNNDTYKLSKALDEVTKGALSFNGQRCTALKMIFAPKGKGALVAKELARRVEKMKIGFPWEKDTAATNALYSQITPLPNHDRVEYMEHLIKDAISKGASIQNKNGGYVVGEGERVHQGTIIHTNVSEDDTSVTTTSNLMVPAVLFPVTPDMDLYHEEQFGPLIPVAEYDADLKQLIQYGQDGSYGQQVSIFTSNGADGDAASLVDQFSAVFGKININSQCGRSPDTVPFSARKSSGMGIMSVEAALREFSIPTVVAYKDDGVGNTARIVDVIRRDSQFMSSV